MNKIAFITSSFSDSGQGGDTIYSSQVIKALKSLGYKLDVIDIEKKSSEGFFNVIIVMLSFLFFPHMWRGWLFNKEILFRLGEFAEYDLIFVDHFRNAWLVLILRMYCKGRVVIVQHNVESDIVIQALKEKGIIEKIIYYYDYFKLALFEKLLSRIVDGMTFITQEDKFRWKEKHKLIFPVETLLPYIESEVDRELLYSCSSDGLIIGSFYWKVKRDNLIGLLESYKRNQFAKKFRLTIAGSMPDNFYEYISRNYDVNVLRDFDGILNFKGRFCFAIAPDNVGGGFKLKLLDYIQLQLPIHGLKGAMNGVEGVVNYVYSYDSFDEMFSNFDYPCSSIKLGGNSLRRNIGVFSVSEMCKNLDSLLHRLENKT